MRGIQILRYGERLRVRELEAPKLLDQSQILIKMNFAPINPSDKHFGLGVYGVKRDLPTVLGFEGCGEIIDVGDKQKLIGLLGKKVACWNDQAINSGTWGQYFVTSSQSILQLDEDVKGFQIQDYASSFINPFTIVGFYEIIKKENPEWVILNGGNSSLSKMAVKYFNSKSIKTAVIVRNKESQISLEKLGAQQTFIQDENFANIFSQFIKKNPRKMLFFDSVAGEQAGQIISLLPPLSQIYCYGVLSQKPLSAINPKSLYFEDKTIKGFWLTRWLNQLDTQQLSNVKNEVQQNLEKYFKTQINQIYEIDQIQEAMNQFNINSNNQGKILLKLN